MEVKEKKSYEKPRVIPQGKVRDITMGPVGRPPPVSQYQ